MKPGCTLRLVIATFLLIVAVSTASAGQAVLFDQAHGQRFLASADGPLDLSGLAAIFTESGFSVTSSAAPLSEHNLANIDAIIISGQFAPLSQEETDTVIRFIERGGKIAIMLHIAPPAAPLIRRLGANVANGVMREVEGVLDNNPLNFSVTHLEPHQLFVGITSFNLYGGWALLAAEKNTATIAFTSSGAWIDLNGDKKRSEGDAVQSFAVAIEGRVGNGAYVIFGDDAIFQNKFLKDGNRQLAENLANWLKR